MRKRSFFVVVIFVIILASLFLMNKPKETKGIRHVLSLIQPPFVKEAQAATSEIGEFLDQEAGIAAWFDGSPIDLDSVRSLYKTIELETSEYIIGSIGVPGKLDWFDMHCYVHVDGWILCYYLDDATSPASKMIDPTAKTISTTKFTTVIANIASAAGIAFTSESYYDFRYPNATNMIMVAKDEVGGREFQIQIPSDYGYFERSWAVFDTQPSSGYFWWDGVSAVGQIWSGNSEFYGILTAAQVLPNVLHTVMVGDWNVYGVLVITYSVP